MDVLSVLLEELIDYAGLYPPASLPLQEAVGNYAAYRAGPRAAWLGRFVLPAARLQAFLDVHPEAFPAARPDALPATYPAAFPDARPDADPRSATAPWRLSALLGESPEADLERVIAFNRAAHAGARPFAVVDTIEMKAFAPEDIPRLETLAPAGLAVYCEIPLREPGPYLAALKQGRGRAKLRTGGVTPEDIPHPADVARWLAACAAARVPFKATAGLHHPVRSLRPVTYAPDAARATMHGFVNVFLAAAFAARGMDVAALAALLGEEDPKAFAFAGGKAAWRGHALPAERLREARRDFALAFGSCSFDEPRQDLEAMGWL